MSSSIHAHAPKLAATQALSTDWNARLNQNPAADQQGGSPAEFSRWLERHVAQGQEARPPAAGPQSSASVEARNAGARAQSETQAQARAQTQAQTQAQLQRRQAESTRSAATDGVKAPEPASRQEGKDAAKASETRASSSRPETARPSKAAEKTSDGSAPAETEASQATEALPAGDGREEGALEGALDETVVLDEQGLPVPAGALAQQDVTSMMAWLSALEQAGDASAEPAFQGDVSTDLPDAWMASGLPPAEDLSATLSGTSTADLQDQLGVDGMVSTIGLAPQDQELSLELRPGRVESAGTLSPEMLRGQGAASLHSARASESLPTPVNHPQFQQALSERVGLWVKGMGEGESLNAELHLNPASMGSISVKIALDGRLAQVDFAAATLETRRAIEDSMPLLSAALNEVGLKLGGSAVSDQSAQSAFARPEDASGQRSARAGSQVGEEEGGGSEHTMPAPTHSGLNGRLDLYA